MISNWNLKSWDEEIIVHEMHSDCTHNMKSGKCSELTYILTIHYGETMLVLEIEQKT